MGRAAQPGHDDAVSDAAAPPPAGAPPYAPPVGDPVPGPPPTVALYGPPQGPPVFATPGHRPPPSGSAPGAGLVAAPADRPSLSGELLTGLLTTLGLVLLGAPLGLLWGAVAPRPDVVLSMGSLDFVDRETKDFIAADGLLFLLGVAAGVLAAVLAWRLGRHRPLGTLLGLVAGAGLASLVAWRTGIRIDDREALLAAARDPAGTRALDLPLALRSHAALLGWPAGGALTFALIALRRPQSLPE